MLKTKYLIKYKFMLGVGLLRLASHNKTGELNNSKFILSVVIKRSRNATEALYTTKLNLLF